MSRIEDHGGIPRGFDDNSHDRFAFYCHFFYLSSFFIHHLTGPILSIDHTTRKGSIFTFALALDLYRLFYLFSFSFSFSFFFPPLDLGDRAEDNSTPGLEMAFGCESMHSGTSGWMDLSIGGWLDCLSDFLILPNDTRGSSRRG